MPTGIVDENVERPEMSEGGGNGALGGLFLSQITPDASDAAMICERLDAGLHICCDDSAAPLEQPLDGAAPDVARCASDQGDSVLEISTVRMCHDEPVNR